MRLRRREARLRAPLCLCEVLQQGRTPPRTPVANTGTSPPPWAKKGRGATALLICNKKDKDMFFAGACSPARYLRVRGAARADSRGSGVGPPTRPQALPVPAAA
jgi:hypothetical protein